MSDSKDDWVKIPNSGERENEFYTAQLSSDQFELPSSYAQEEQIIEKYLDINKGRIKLAASMVLPLLYARLTNEQKESLVNLIDLDKRFFKAFKNYQSYKTGKLSKSASKKFKNHFRCLEKSGIV